MTQLKTLFCFVEVFLFLCVDAPRLAKACWLEKKTRRLAHQLKLHHQHPPESSTSLLTCNMSDGGTPPEEDDYGEVAAYYDASGIIIRGPH
jgi:hypothetical protein